MCAARDRERPRRRAHRAGEHLEVRGLARISRADVADFMVREAAEREFVRKVVTVAD